MVNNYIKRRLKRLWRKCLIWAVGIFAVCFLLLEIISATAGGIVALLAWEETQCQNQSSSGDDTGDISVGKYDHNLVSMAKAVADAVGKKLGVNPKWIFGQMYQETGFNANASTALKDNNLGGVKYSPSMSKWATPGGGVGDNTGGVYAHFKSLDGYATVYAQTVKNMLGGKTPHSVEEYVDILASKHYFGSYHGGSFYADATQKAQYVAGIKAGMKLYDSAKTNKSASVKNMAYTIKSNKKVKSVSKKIKPLPTLKDLMIDVDHPETGQKFANGKMQESKVDYIQSKTTSLSGKFIQLENMDGEGDTNGGSRDFRTRGDKSDQAWSDDIKKNVYAGKKEIDKTIQEATNKVEKGMNDTLGTKFNTGDNTKKLEKAKNDANQAQKEAKKADQKVKDSEQADHDDMIANCDVDGDNSAVSGKWQWPFKGIPDKPDYLNGGQFGISSGSSGARGTSFHDGFDWSNGLNGVHIGSKIYAITGGTVYKIGHGGLRGWFIDIKAGKYYITYQEAFLSRSSINVKEGQNIKAGDLIGTLDDSGSGHLHLGISKKEIESAQSSWDKDDGTWLDPIKIIKEGMKSGNNGDSNLHLSGSEDSARKWIIQHESSGSYSAVNGKYYGAYQLDKSYITSKKYGGDGSLSKKNQDYVAEKYMKERYGTWQKAKAHWEANNWW